MLKKYLKYIFLLFTVFSMWQFPGRFAFAATISDQDSVVIDALVPSEIPPASGGIQVPPDTIAPKISDVVIDNITFYSARISWNTDELCVPQINFGKTPELEKTYIGESFTTKNAIFLDELDEGTVYYIEIVAIDRGGNRTAINNLSFKTLSKTEIIVPQNVSGLRAVPGDSKISLFWKNSQVSDFDKVFIARNDAFFPKNIGEGTMAYYGNEETFVDLNLVNGKRYYYSVFSVDLNGNISSGAAVSAIPFKSAPEIPPEKPSVPPEKPEVPPEIPPEFPPEKPEIPPEIVPDIDKLSINDFDFLQDGLKIEMKEGKLEIDPGKEIIVTIDASKIPEEVDSIMIILTRENEEYSYLMKKDKEKGIFSASIRLSAEGSFDVTIVLLDKKNRIIKALNGSISPAVTTKPPENRFSSMNYIPPFLILLLIIILCTIKKYLSYERKNKSRKIGIDNFKS